MGIRNNIRIGEVGLEFQGIEKKGIISEVLKRMTEFMERQHQ